MSWITELAKVYDNTIRNADNSDGDSRPIPMFHTANNASVTITVDETGAFVDAKLVTDKKERVTVMPCTESNAARTSGADAYPLCDKLEYVSGDSAKHNLYAHLLEAWAESDFATEKVEAVWHYVQKETLLQDLQASGIKRDDVKDFIRWSVEIPGDTKPADLWKDEAAQKSWIDFYNSEAFESYVKAKFRAKEQSKYIRKTDLDYTEGSFSKIAAYHPAKIDGGISLAKIISSNDTDNYTFRGRFKTDIEACQISSDVTQKAHSALRWLIKKQGFRILNEKQIPMLSVVTWNRAGDSFPQLTAGSTDLLPIKTGSNPQKTVPIGELDFGFEEPEKEEPQGIYQTSREFAEAVNNRLKGYYGDISHPQNIMVMAIKEATPGKGRASIILYRELQNSDLLEALNNWYRRLSWQVTYWEKKNAPGEKSRQVHSIGTPSPQTIAECAYGERVKANLVEKTVQRILPCILDGGAIPSDVETQCVRTASNLLAVESYRRDRVLETACAVYKYNQIIKTRNEEVYQLALEENRTSRDYLYGRLLAVEQQYESAALRKAGQERETNAVRYMQQFSMHPAKTWLMLYKDKLPAYRRLLEQGRAGWFEKQIQDISALFQGNDYMNDKPLSGEFLLGYQCQLKAFRKNNDDSPSEDTEE